MNRNTRTLVVLLVAILTAGAASFGVYLAIKRMPVREVEVAHTFIVAAVHPLAPGARLTSADVKLVPWPQGAMVPGAFSKIEDVIDRGVIVQLLENEPLADAKLAPVAAGSGLSPTIPSGMRAISVRVNEVIGVAGFVTPGTRVDVLVTLKQAETSLTRVVLSNVQVLTAGTRYDQDQSKEGAAAIPSSVVTLLVTPEDAERIVLASNDGQIMLALRNPMDVAPTTTQGTRTAGLFGAAPPPPESPVARPVARPRPPVVAPPPPPPEPVAPPPYSVEAIRGAKRTEETLR